MNKANALSGVRATVTVSAIGAMLCAITARLP
jgi:hypothetical protein